jgi:hypothetical protein
MARKNHAAKSRKQDQPYEVWVAPGFEWRVLKKWQANDSTPYARWFCATKGPGTFGSYELGDGYVVDIKTYGTLLWRDPAYAQAANLPLAEDQPEGESLMGAMLRQGSGYVEVRPGLTIVDARRL